MPTLIEVPVGQLRQQQQGQQQQQQEQEEDDSEESEQDDDDENDETTVYDRSMTLVLDDSLTVVGDFGSSERRSTSLVRQLPNKASDDTQRENSLEDGSITILSDTDFDCKGMTAELQSRGRSEESSLLSSVPIHNPQTQPTIGGGERLVDLPRRRSPLRTVTIAAGPNEIVYRSQHESFVKTTIQKFHHSHPGKLKDYRSLTKEEQTQEQRRVLALLSRLKILGKKDGRNEENVSLSHHSIIHQRMGHVHTTNRPTEKPVDYDSDSDTQHQRDYNDDDDGNISFAMPDQDSPKDSHHRLFHHQEYASPIEIARFAKDTISPVSPESSLIEDHVYGGMESAATYRHTIKRPATLSAKRGTDLVRIRFNDDDHHPHQTGYDEHQDADSDTDDGNLSSRMGRLSIEAAGIPNLKEDFFPASQSPISPHLTYDSSEDDEEYTNTRTQPQLRRPTDDTIQSWSTCKASERQSKLRTMPAHVGMKAGATFHLEKLCVQRSEIVVDRNRAHNGKSTVRRLVNFPDPLSKYHSKQRRAFNDVFESFQRSEQESKHQTFVETSSVNVLLSMSYEQISDLCLKLFLDDESHPRNPPARGRDGASSKTLSPLQGQTLIVARSKEDLIHWERALREGTGCSVYNIATAPLSERVRIATADKATKYDVVLATFDVLKSPDTAIPVDNNGYAIIPGSYSSKEEATSWMSSRGGSSQAGSRPQKCVQLSVLHKINFRRAIFLDVLGRKSFLAKFGTARARASATLRANSRIVFFCESKADGTSAFQALKKSDSRAQESLCDVLHLVSQNREGESDDSSSDEDEKDAFASATSRLERCILDIKDILYGPETMK